MMTTTKKTLIALALCAFLTTGCASKYSRADTALGGAMAGAAAGGIVGAGAGSTPGQGIGVGIAVGAVVGGLIGLIWPSDADDD